MTYLPYAVLNDVSLDPKLMAIYLAEFHLQKLLINSVSPFRQSRSFLTIPHTILYYQRHYF